MLPPAPAPPAAAPTTAAPAPATASIPLALVAAFALAYVGSTALDFYFAGFEFSRGFGQDDFAEKLARYELLGVGVYVAFLALALGGGIELLRRTFGTAQLGARVIVGAIGVLIATTVVRRYLQLSDGPHDAATAIWISRVIAAAYLAVSIGALVVGWHDRQVRLLAAPLIVATLLSVPFDFYADHLGFLYRPGGRYLSIVIDAVLDGTMTALLIAVLVIGRPPAEATHGFDRAARGMNRAAFGLYTQGAVTIATIFMILMMTGSRDGGMGVAKLYIVGAPLVIVVATLIAVGGVIGAAGLTAPGAPRLRLYASAAALMVGFGITAVQVTIIAKYMLGESHDDLSSTLEASAQALPIGKAVIGLVALATFASGLVGLARTVGSDELAKRAGVAIAVVVVSQLVGIGVPYLLMSSRDLSPGDVIAALVLAAICVAVSVLVLARTCRLLATALSARHDLPVANLFA